MEFKNIIKEYKEYTKGYAERSETLLKAFGGVPEPTDEERQQAYDAKVFTKYPTPRATT